MAKTGQWLSFKAAFGATVFSDTEIIAWKNRLEAKLHRLGNFLAVLETDPELEMEVAALDLALKSLRGDLELAHTRYAKASARSDKDGRTAAIQDFKEVEARAKQARLTYEPLARRALLADPAGVTALPEGREYADRLVAGVSPLTAKEDTKALMATLIQGRFGLDQLVGDLSAKKLKATYTLLALMPEAHTRDNDAFEVLELHSGAPSGFYVERERRAVVYSRDVDPLHSDSYVPGDTGDTVPAPYQHKGRRQNIFNHTLLHEIGHAVDSSTGTMKDHGREAAFGGWETVQEEIIAQAFVEEHGLCAAFPELPAELLRFYAVDCVEHGEAADAKLEALWAKLAARASSTPDPSRMVTNKKVRPVLELYARYEDPEDEEHVWPATPGDRELLLSSGMLSAISQAERFSPGTSLDDGKAAAYRNAASLMFRRGGGQAPEAAFLSAAQEAVRALREDFSGPVPDITAVKAHATIRLCKEYAGLQGLWERGGEGARRFTAGRWVYARSSDRLKYRYLASERQKAVTRYQWNAPGEWFAELYALYMADNLKPTHPAVPLFLSDLGEPLAL
ncbi:MAG: hypothetical protein H6741_01280 [Alphaproteobacteria bacterium]|nr:hypothetical protein [Alphaproteobacteria bacterium]